MTLLGSGLMLLTRQVKLDGVPSSTLTDPANDARYAAVAKFDLWDAYNSPNQALAGEYADAKRRYDASVSAAEHERFLAESSRDGFAALSLLVLLLFGLSWLPWDRWAFSVASKAKTVAAPVTEFVTEQFASDGTKIIGHEKLQRYSVADELLKWTELQEKGVVTDAEFEEARRKILKRDA